MQLTKRIEDILPLRDTSRKVTEREEFSYEAEGFPPQPADEAPEVKK
jgi:hypothetical protein